MPESGENQYGKLLVEGADHVKNKIEVQVLNYLIKELEKEIGTDFLEDFKNEVLVWLIGSEETKKDPKSPNFGQRFGDWFKGFTGKISEGELLDIYLLKPRLIIQSMIVSGIIAQSTVEDYLRQVVEQFRMGPENLMITGIRKIEKSVIDELGDLSDGAGV